MKKYLPLLLLIVVVASCRSTWNEADDNTFNKACLDDANTWAGSHEKAGIYCNCVIAKVKQRYPDENDAMNHIKELTTDSTSLSCKALIMGK